MPVEASQLASRGEEQFVVNYSNICFTFTHLNLLKGLYLWAAVPALLTGVLQMHSINLSFDFPLELVVHRGKEQH